jgi:hypothetical protein
MYRQRHRVATANREIDAAIRRAKAFEAEDRRAIRAEYDDVEDRISLELSDGVRVSIPRNYLQGLESAEAPQLSKIQILGRGTGLHWPELDVDHYVPGVLSRIFGTAKWMSRVGRAGGTSRSKAKVIAARLNGQKRRTPA